LATKQLRLDVAQLTDVGRKREHNEDNMAYVIPKDPQVMTKKGALFIVADGMGGHAAGEVASEIAVDTVSSVYYQDDSDDVAVSVMHAIKRANASIHQRAAENMSRSGMGTTCVTAILRGDMAYIANVGDSRAYILRNGLVRQVSQDHSWVAEQVRAGILTEDQARTHAQRNVITRCLGTQADVEIDVFAEPLREGDSLVLCTDGLSGLVSDEDLQKIINQFVPQESVYHLVERANENGGSDNITAIVVHVQEVGREQPNGHRAIPVGGYLVGADTRTTGPLGTMPLAFPEQTGNNYSGPLRISSGPLTSSDIDTAPQPIVRTPRTKRGRLFFPTLGLIILLLATAAAGAAYVLLRVNTPPDVARSLQQAQALITLAKSEVSSNPALALQHLASAQKTLRGLSSSQLSDTQRTQVTRLLQGDLTTTTRTAIHTYNLQALVTVLPCSPLSTATTINDGSTGTHAQRLAAVQNMTYALGQDGKVYQLKQLSAQFSLASLPAFPGNAQAIDITGGDSELAVLLKQSPSNSYALGLLQPGQQQLKTVASVDKALLVSGQTPTLVAARGADVYVVLTSPPAANAAENALLLDFTLDTAKGTLKTGPRSTQLALSSTIVSIAALPNHLLFLSLANGSVQSLQLPNTGPSPLPIKAPSPTNVLVQQPIAPSLGIGEAAFTPATPVPTVAPPAVQTGSTPLTVSSPAPLSTNLVGNVPHLYIADTAHRRLLDLQPAPNGGSGNPMTLQLVRQYVSSGLFAQVKSLTLNSSGGTASVLTQKNQAVFSLVSVNLNAQAQDTCL
jgi:serine/threonine protein phosphatase PrpC